MITISLPRILNLIILGLFLTRLLDDEPKNTWIHAFAFVKNQRMSPRLTSFKSNKAGDPKVDDFKRCFVLKENQFFLVTKRWMN